MSEPSDVARRSSQAAAGSATVIDNPWQVLGGLTPARIGLGRSGVSQPTAVQLDFQLAHAMARDAVHCVLDSNRLCGEIEALGLSTVALHSAAATRPIYLQRPDLGRQLDEESRQRLRTCGIEGGLAKSCDLALVVADGLSALAVQRHAAPLIGELLAALHAAADAGTDAWQLAPVAVVQQGRVAIGDEIGALLRSRLVVVLIGERPGLSSPDSLGIYLTWAPLPGRRDSQRNCISNVRPQGLSYREAASRLLHLLRGSRQRQLSGVDLKDDSLVEEVSMGGVASLPHFLLGADAEADDLE